MTDDRARSPAVGSAAQSHTEAVRAAFAAAFRGDLDAVRELLAEDVRWYQAGYEGSGCQNRDQAMVWMGETIARGVRAELLDVRALDENRVLVLLERNLRRDGDATAEPPAPHGQIVTFKEGKVTEIVVYPSDNEALDAAGEPGATL
jgi:ketosteroid isomerase-like protein